MSGGPLKDLLFLSAHVPSRFATEAGGVLAYQHLAALAESFRVHLVCFASGHETWANDGSLGVHCASHQVIRHTQWARLYGAAIHPTLPVYVAIRHRRAVVRALESVRGASQGPLVVWAEYTQMGAYACYRGPQETWVLACQDVLTELWRRWEDRASGLWRHILSFERDRLQKWEKGVLRAFDLVVALSPKDAGTLSGLGAQRVAVAYPGVAVTPISHLCQGSPTIVFLGAMNRSENVDAVRWFAERIWPRVRNHVSRARFLVVGANPPVDIRTLQYQDLGIEVTGYVKDVGSWLQQGWFAVAPIRMGAGVKIKVLTTLASGLPVVSTSMGAEGIPATAADGLVVRDEAEGFAEACIGLLEDPGRCRTLGAAAKEWFDRDYQPLQADAARLAAIVAEATGILRS